MKIKRAYQLVLVGSLLAISAACGFNVSTANISGAFTAREVNGVMEATKTFNQDEVFYLLVTLKNAPDDTVIKAVWYAADVEGTAKNTLIDEAKFTGSDQQITFDLSNDKLWPVGTYKVEVHLNDKLNQTLEFSVEGSAEAKNNIGAAPEFDAYLVSKASGDAVETQVFAADEPFYLIVDLTKAPADTISKAVWYAVDVVGADANTLIDEAEFQGNGEVTFDLSNNGPWPTGQYGVELFLNGVSQGSIAFSVE